MPAGRIPFELPNAHAAAKLQKEQHAAEQAADEREREERESHDRA